MKTISPIRQQDTWGSGGFGDPRGDRVHRGIDYNCAVHSRVLAPVTGKVTKLGYTYPDDLRFRYVQITDEKGLKFRSFYVEPCVKKGDMVIKDTNIIGTTQMLGHRYPSITEHCHLEIIDKEGAYLNPEDYL